MYENRVITTCVKLEEPLHEDWLEPDLELPSFEEILSVEKYTHHEVPDLMTLLSCD
jgi:hypothetical protein